MMRSSLRKALLAAWIPLVGVHAEPLHGTSDPLASPAELEARVWLDRGGDPVLQPGDEVRVYYRASTDAYAAILHVDTNGFVRLLFPSGPGDPNRLLGERDYRLLFPRDTEWVVEDLPGVGYFFLVASPDPLDFSALGYSPLRGGWDLAAIGSRIDRDPYLAVSGFVEHLLPGWERGEFALDFTAYHVGQSYSYPRFLCYECHGYQPLRSWNPYHAACLNFRVVIYNDPYFYPAARYQGSRVVYTRPPASGLAQFAFKERAAGEAGTPLVQARPGLPETAGAPNLRIQSAQEMELRTFLEAWRGTPGPPSRPEAVPPAWPVLGIPPESRPRGATLLPVSGRAPTSADPPRPRTLFPLPAMERGPRSRPVLERRAEPPPPASGVRRRPQDGSPRSSLPLPEGSELSYGIPSPTFSDNVWNSSAVN